MDLRVKEEIFKGDFEAGENDEYLKSIEYDSKKNRILKISMGVIYVSLLVISLFIL